MDATMNLVIKVDTGAEPYFLIVYKSYFPKKYIPLWKKAGLYTLFYLEDRPPLGACIFQLTDALIDMCANSDKYLDGFVFSEEEILKGIEDYRQVIYLLASIIQVSKKFPKAYVELKDKNSNEERNPNVNR